MQNDHNQTCNCYDCVLESNTNHVDSPIGKFIKSNKPVNLYKVPGGKPLRTAQPKSYIGKVQNLNTKKTWLQTTEGLWVHWSKDLYFNDAKPLTAKEIAEAKEIAFLSAATASSGPVAETSYKVAKGAAETVEGVAKTISFVGANLKWIVLMAALAILIGLFLRLKG